MHSDPCFGKDEISDYEIFQITKGVLGTPGIKVGNYALKLNADQTLISTKRTHYAMDWH